MIHFVRVLFILVALCNAVVCVFFLSFSFFYTYQKAILGLGELILNLKNNSRQGKVMTYVWTLGLYLENMRSPGLDSNNKSFRSQNFAQFFGRSSDEKKWNANFHPPFLSNQWHQSVSSRRKLVS